MPKKHVTDPITDQEIDFARLVLSGTMTDRCAAGAAGLNPDTAAYTKAKPRVRAYMQEHRAAVREQLVDQDADLSRQAVEQQRQTRERLLTRLWEIADLDSEKTRGSMSSQVKALSLIAAIEGLIPSRSPVAAQSKPTTPPLTADIYASAWLGKQQENPDVRPETAPEPPSPPADAPPPVSDPTVDPLGRSISPQTAAFAPRVPGADFVTPVRAPFSIKRNPFSRRS